MLLDVLTVLNCYHLVTVHSRLTDWLTARGRVCLEKLTVPQLVRHNHPSGHTVFTCSALDTDTLCIQPNYITIVLCCNSVWKLICNCRRRVPSDVTHFMQYWLAAAGGRVAPSLMRRTCRSFGHTRLLFGQLNCFFQLFYLCCLKHLHRSTLKPALQTVCCAALNNWFNQFDRSKAATAISLSDKDKDTRNSLRNSTVPLSFFPTCSTCSRFPLFLVTFIRFLLIIKPFKVGNPAKVQPCIGI